LFKAIRAGVVAAHNITVAVNMGAIMAIHRKKQHPTSFPVFFLLVVILLLAGCHRPVNTERTTTDGMVDRTGTSVLILPFYDLTEIYGNQNRIRCPVCGESHETGPVEEDAVSRMSRYLAAGMEQRGGYRILPSDAAQGGMTMFLAGGGTVLHDDTVFLKTVESLGADFLMIGYIFRYQERVGTWYSVKNPASIAFGLHLIDVKTGKSRWSKHFDETQSALSENLFHLGRFFRRGASWITAQEMAEAALDETLQTLPKP
jgi:hypothetical protein